MAGPFMTWIDPYFREAPLKSFHPLRGVEMGAWGLGLLLAASLVFGFVYRAKRGRVHPAKSLSRDLAPSALDLSPLTVELGSRGSFIQFSSAFCTPCRATRLLLEGVATANPGFIHHDIDAEAHLELVRRLHILSTPTTIILDRNGVEVGRASGAPKRDDIERVVASLR